MKRKRFSVEQIVAVVKQAERGLPVADLIRQVISQLLEFARLVRFQTGVFLLPAIKSTHSKQWLRWRDLSGTESSRNFPSSR